MERKQIAPEMDKGEALKQMATQALRNLPNLSNEDQYVSMIVVVARSLKRFGSITPEVRKVIDEYVRLNPGGKAGIEKCIEMFPDTAK